MIGSREWMTLSEGKLNFKEKTQLIKQVLVPATLNYSKTFIRQSKNSQHFELKNIQIPDTSIVKEAIFELENTQNQAIIHHSWRSYIWGVAIAQIQDWQFDEESLLIASLMHDLSLIEHLEHYSCQCFTFESSLRSESLCVKHHYPKDKIDNISNAICLHMNGHLDKNNQNLSKEVLLLQKATSCDVIGTDLGHLSIAFKDEVLSHYPRSNFNSTFKKLLKTETKKNPDSRTALLSKLGLPLMISMNTFKE
ncbi:hypothetical protein AMD27_08980 [Acinetobacter sp. TGL-Y2]|uniref:hypothetical protein n=1 Tax=Acinetobacter sp. TGL-Y2 TaxID=1407071 RepID=UPI0007A64E48|nr:hypothetical protein [Acinetobacter sp. TGL-Y2]AMW79003.1 hypothetical protein AMD27_08980 [Acinetobacter sp. TGL-Y2]